MRWLAWSRTDQYHRVLTTSGTFVNQAWPFDPKFPDGAWGFHETLNPKEPKKPIRLFIQVGDRDLLSPNVTRDDMHDWVEAMMSAAEPRELHPIAARPPGSFVSFTLQCFSTRGSTSSSMYVAKSPFMLSYSLPRSCPWASPPPFWNAISTIGGIRFWAIRLSRTVL